VGLSISVQIRFAGLDKQPSRTRGISRDDGTVTLSERDNGTSRRSCRIHIQEGCFAIRDPAIALNVILSIIGLARFLTDVVVPFV